MNIFIEVAYRFVSIVPALLYLAIPITAMLAFKYKKSLLKKFSLILFSMPVLLFLYGAYLDARDGVSIIPAKLGYIVLPFMLPSMVDKKITRIKASDLILQIYKDDEEIDKLVKKYPDLKEYEHNVLTGYFFSNTMITKDNEIYTTLTLRGSPYLTGKQIRYLWDRSNRDYVFRDAIRGSPLTPIDLLREIYEEDKEKNGGLNITFYSALLRNPNLPEDIVEEIRKSSDAQSIYALEIYNTSYKEKYSEEIKLNMKK